MIVRLIHPQHGAMHVYSADDLERHRKLGWVPEGEEQPAEQLVALPVVDEPPKRKPGRPKRGE